MKVKLAKHRRGESSKTLDYKDFTQVLEDKRIVFLEPNTDAAVFDKLEKDYEVVKFFKAKYGLGENDFVYEVHLIG